MFNSNSTPTLAPKHEVNEIRTDIIIEENFIYAWDGLKCVNI